MRKIILSLAVIALVSAGAIQATRSYFFDDEIISGNTFSTGNVTLNRDWIYGVPFTLTNMAPGEVYTRNIDLYYAGSVNADLFIGVGGTRSETDYHYIADQLKVKIQNTTTNTTIFNNYANYLSSQWKKIAADVPYYGLNQYEITFTLDNDFDKQNVVNDDTVFIFYATQTGTSAPTLEPYKYYIKHLCDQGSTYWCGVFSSL
jgi:hypothetical protein